MCCNDRLSPKPKAEVRVMRIMYKTNIKEFASMKKAEKMERLILRAKEYARSGDYVDGVSVEIALRGEFPGVKFTRFEKQEYDEMCRQAQNVKRQ